MINSENIIETLFADELNKLRSVSAEYDIKESTILRMIKALTKLYEFLWKLNSVFPLPELFPGVDGVISVEWDINGVEMYLTVPVIESKQIEIYIHYKGDIELIFKNLGEM